MIKKILIYIVIVFSIFLFVDSVQAKGTDMNITLNGDSSRLTYFSGGRNVTMAVYSNGVVSSIADTPSFGYAQFCTDATITSNYSVHPDYLSNINIIDTGVPCTNGGINNGQATVQYVTFSTPSWSCSVQGANCVYGFSLVFYQETSSNYYLMSAAFTDEPVDIDTSSGTIINQNQTIINQNQDIINQNEHNNQQNDRIIGEQEETNQTLDEIKDMDISEEDKELPDDTEFNNYQDAEDDLMEKVEDADMSVLDVAIDVDSSNFVWETLTDLIQSHTLIFGTVIAILSIGIIKLALGR